MRTEVRILMARGKKLFLSFSFASKIIAKNRTAQVENRFFNKDYIQFMPYMLSINVPSTCGRRSSYSSKLLGSIIYQNPAYSASCLSSLFIIFHISGDCMKHNG